MKHDVNRDAVNCELTVYWACECYSHSPEWQVASAHILGQPQYTYGMQALHRPMLVTCNFHLSGKTSDVILKNSVQLYSMLKYRGDCRTHSSMGWILVPS